MKRDTNITKRRKNDKGSAIPSASTVRRIAWRLWQEHPWIAARRFSSWVSRPSVILLLACCGLLSWNDPPSISYGNCSNTRYCAAANSSSTTGRLPNDVVSFFRKLQQEEANKNSSLRFDWTNLPPVTPLGKAIERSQSQCLNASAVKKFGPQRVVHFQLIASGMGSSLHTWMNALCHAAENNKVLITGGNNWAWNEAERCSYELDRKQLFKPADWPQSGSTKIPAFSSLWCYFGWHESALRCPPGTVAWNKRVIDHRRKWRRYKCNRMQKENGRLGVHSAVAEWLFQNVSKFVILEAERQIREEAFPITTDTNSSIASSADGDTFQRWPGLPDADSLITVHIRWGDKAREMDLVSMDEVIHATQSLLTPDELAGLKKVHIYVATEDPEALAQFSRASQQFNWQVHSSGPTNPTKGEYDMISTAFETQGRAGLQSLAALLISLEANRYVLSRGSNWSRLIDELRKSIVDSRCGNCTKMIDLRFEEG